MLDQYEVGATIPAADMQRAKKWYEEKLGLTPDEENPGGARYRCGSAWFKDSEGNIQSIGQRT